MAEVDLPRNDTPEAHPERGTVEWRIRRIERYLYRLGLAQLFLANLTGFFWIAWSEGIRKRKRSSRLWVITVHALIAAGFAWHACVLILDLPAASVAWPRGVPGYVLSMALVFLFGWPIVQLVRHDVTDVFRSRGGES